MNNLHDNTVCRRLRAAPDGFWKRIKQRLAERCASHIASCPRCQKRLANTGRVEMALCLMRMQPHQTDLLSKANTAALKYIKRSLRQTPSAERLRTAVPGPGRFAKTAPLLDRLINVAACLFIVLMVRAGMMSKMFEIREQGEKVIERYYAKNLDAQLYEDIFGSPTDSSTQS